jgi:glycerol-3-phosphate dehydrogenase
VLGAGNFGSCLADHLGDSKHAIFLWSRDPELLEHFNLHRRNIHYLKNHVFSENIEAVGPELPDRAFIEKMNVILFAIPTQGLR